MTTDINTAYQWHNTRIAEVFGYDRGTVRRKLRAAGVSPASTKDGLPLYKLSEAVPALYRQEAVGQDPNLMTPQDRRAWYDSENERLKVEDRASHLVPAGDADREMSHMAQVLSHRLDTLPEQLACVLSAGALAHVRQRVDGMKQMLETHIETDE